MSEPRPGDFYPMDPNPVQDETVITQHVTERHRTGLPSYPVRLKALGEIAGWNLFDDMILQQLQALAGRDIQPLELHEWSRIFDSMGVRTQIRRYFKRA